MQGLTYPRIFLRDNFRTDVVGSVDNFGAWRSLVARTVRDREVGGSNPLAPILFLLGSSLLSYTGLGVIALK